MRDCSSDESFFHVPENSLKTKIRKLVMYMPLTPLRDVRFIQKTILLDRRHHHQWLWLKDVVWINNICHYCMSDIEKVCIWAV